MKRGNDVAVTLAPLSQKDVISNKMLLYLYDNKECSDEILPGVVF
jgi:hypothetical protein